MKVKQLIEVLNTFDPDAEVCRYQWNDLDASSSYEYVESAKQVATVILNDGSVYNEVYLGGEDD